MTFHDFGIYIPKFVHDVASMAGVFAFDLETTGLNPRTDRIEGLSIYVPETVISHPVRAWFPFVSGTMKLQETLCLDCAWSILDLNAIGECLKCGASGDRLKLSPSDARPPLDQQTVMLELRDGLFADESLVAVAHNAKFDLAFLLLASGLEGGVILKNKVADSMISYYLQDENSPRFGLKHAVKRVFEHEMTTYEETRSTEQATFAWETPTPLGVYAMDDVEWCFKLYKWSMESLREQDPSGRLEKLFWDLEMPLTKIIGEMERTGVHIDWQWLQTVSQRLDDEKLAVMHRVEGVIKGLCDSDVLYGKTEAGETRDWGLNKPNLSSPKDVSSLLYSPRSFGGYGLPTKGVERMNKSGLYPTKTIELKQFVGDHPFVADILEFRSLEVKSNSFAKKILKLVLNEPNGRLYASFNQTGTKIGRLSSSNPINFMNQPRDPDLIRRSFSCTDGMLLFGADYDQIELKVMAHLSQDKKMLDVYRNENVCPGNCEAFVQDGRCRHVDIHQRTADDIGVTRSAAKGLNFGVTYRIGPFRYCQTAGLFKDSKPQLAYAKKVIRDWLSNYSGVQAFHRWHENNLIKNDYISYTMTGRRRRLKEAYRLSDYRAVTQAIQFSVSGSAQDIMKNSMRKIWVAREKMISGSYSADAELWRKFRFLIQVHDEVVCEGPEELKDEIKLLIESNMRSAASLRVPLTAECNYGKNWDEIH